MVPGYPMRRWLAAVSTLLVCACASAQDVEVKVIEATSGPGQPAIVVTEGGPPGAVQAAMPAGAMPGGPPGKPERGPGKPDGKPEAKPDAKPEAKPPGEGGKKDDSKPGEAKVVTRPDKPTKPPNPEELQITPDPSGKIRFNFRGQSWPDVLDWLARVSGMSLDWQELPGDYLNLTTQRGYSIEEAKDLINRHLLARGFTILENGEILSVVSIAKLNPGLVPRVEPEELAAHMPHSFVKVSFPLEWLRADTAVEELQPLMSPNGKLNSLDATNRLEAMDAVVNLRELFEVLRSEQSPTGQERLVKEFPLKYAKASDVLTQLETLLGMERKSRSMSSGGNPQEMAQQQARMMAEMQQQQQQQMQQMQQAQQQQQQQQQRGGKSSRPSKEPSINLVINPRKNSILANAPPDKMAIIEQAIKTLDVQSDRVDSLLTNPTRMQVYRLHAIDPDALVRTLQDVGELSPSTRLEVDAKNKALIAYASLADHVVIRQLVERLDGSGRRFEVVTLRRLAADYVAGTIDFMMNGKKQDDEQPRYYDPWSYRGRQEEEPREKFRVDADVENNRLLLYASDIEIEEVTNLLVKLGELPPEGGDRSTLRVLNAVPPEEAAQLFEKLRKAWPSLAPNPLQLPSLPEPKPEPEKRPNPPAKRPAPPEKAEDPSKSIRSASLIETSLQASEGETAAEAKPAEVKAAETKPSDLKAEEPKTGEVKTTDPKPAEPKVGEIQPGETKTADPKTPAPKTTAPKAAAPQPADPEPSDPRPVDPPAAESPMQAAPPAVTPSEGQMPSTESAPQAAAPPVSISIGPDGNLVISSEDPAALDMLQELITKLAPATPEYEVFRLKHADAFWVVKNLEEFFKEDDDSKKQRNPFMFFDYPPPQRTDEKSNRLSKRKKLKFIDDIDTNSIIVQGADARQLKTVKDLIEVYDKPMSSDAQTARFSSVIAVRYSKADVIADAVKDLYRDLLSSNDKALTQGPDQRNRAPSQTYIFNEGGESPDRERTQVSFKGKLSIGVDTVTNTLLVSTEGETLLKNVTELVKNLDEAAKPLSTVQVIPLEGGVNADRIRKVLNAVVGDGKNSSGPSDKPNGPQKPPSKPQGRGPQGNSQSGDQRGK